MKATDSPSLPTLIMQANTNIDVLIIGHGLAGATLATALEQLGKKVCIISQPMPGAASQVASGMWNPLTFRLLLKSWRVDELLPVALDFYNAESARLGISMLQNLDILRIFPDESADVRWQERLREPEFEAYLRPEQPTSLPHNIELKQKQGLVKQAGWLNLPVYLQKDRDHRLADGSLLEQAFEFNDVHFSPDGLRWNNICAQQLVVCRGQFERHHPWFNWLPLKPAQGDILTLHIPQIKLEQIYNAGFFILPLGNDRYRLGATYEWEQLAAGPTAAGKAELLAKFEAVYHGTYEVLDHQGGIRPTVADRRPLLGFHPAQARLGIFNGLGTKGVMIAPYFARQFAQVLCATGTIEDEVNIKRFKKRYEQHTGSRWNDVAL
jgi:glycine/D-amino acid oxidase-like deaminating enzyme